MNILMLFGVLLLGFLGFRILIGMFSVFYKKIPILLKLWNFVEGSITLYVLVVLIRHYYEI